MPKQPYIHEVPSSFPRMGGTEIHITNSEVPDQSAQFAMDLMARMALAAGHEDGEDSAGRAKIRLQTPGEVVERACAISELAFTAFEKRGWMISLPECKIAPARPPLDEEP